MEHGPSLERKGADPLEGNLARLQSALRESEQLNQRLREQLCQVEERYQALLQSSPDYIFAVDRQGTILYINHTAPGYSTEQVIGRPVVEFVPPECRDSLLETLERTLETGEPQDLEIQATSRQWFKAQYIPLDRTEEGEVTTALCICSEVTERKEALVRRQALEARIQQAQKVDSLGVLAGGIAHDFNNLLGGVLMNVELALEKSTDAATTRPLLEAARAVASHASELTQQLLAYSGEGAFVLQPIDLNALVEDMLQILAATASKKATVHRELSEELPGVTADPTQLRQVVMNLVTNASEALGDEGGRITIRTLLLDRQRVTASAAWSAEELQADSFVCLQVEDEGPGMDVETRTRMFDPFFSTKFTGRGLGLAAVLGIVRGHGGAISVESEPGRGTTLSVMLPSLGHMVEAKPPREPMNLPADERLRGTVLVVDDEPHLRRVVQLSLEDYGYRVFTAGTGQDAISLYREHADEVKVVLLDLLMPDMDGFEVLGELQAVRADLPVILSSGYSKEVALDHAEGAGQTRFLKKPYHLDQLLEAVGKAID